MKNENYEVQILVGGKPTKQHYHNGQYWVEAQKGTEYTVKVKNNTAGRIMAIVSIDGVDVISGEAASADSSGYIVNSFRSSEIKGFRVSDTEVNAFEFGDIGDSYAALSAAKDVSAKNCGVIGVRVYKEKEAKINLNDIWRKKAEEMDKFPRPRIIPHPDIYPWGEPYQRPYRTDCVNMFGGTVSLFTSDSSAQSCNLNSVVRSANFDVGTKFGEERSSKVTYVEFERGELAMEHCIYYASRDKLIETGVIIVNPLPALPLAFKDSEKKYCVPPKRR